MTTFQALVILMIGLLILSVAILCNALEFCWDDYRNRRRIDNEIKEAKKENKDVDIYI